MTNPIFSEDYKKMIRLVKNNENKTDVCAIGFDYKSNKYVIIFKYPYKDIYFDTYEELKNIIKERRSKMRKDKLSSFQAKKQKLLKIKAVLSEGIEEKKAWKMTPMDLIEYYQVQTTKIWEIVKDEK